jgi:predicted nucleic acid-binding protein
VILLDTNVLSEIMRPRPAPEVIAWLNTLPQLSVWTSSITVFEIEAGLGILPVGRRRSEMEEAFARLLSTVLQNRIAPFDFAAAHEAARLGSVRRGDGRTGDRGDTMIAGIAISPRATLATRNIRHFDDLPTPVVNPWA